MNKHILINLEFAGIELPVVTDADDYEVVPLKPISDVFGLDWSSQRKRMQTPEMAIRMGICIGNVPYAGQTREMVCIRLKKVVGFLYSINPTSVRSGGNLDGAAFLEFKQDEWDEVLNAYEQQNGIFAVEQDRQSKARSRDLRDFIALHKAKKEATDEDRKVFDGLLQQQAKALGVPYQTDLIH